MTAYSGLRLIASALRWAVVEGVLHEQARSRPSPSQQGGKHGTALVRTLRKVYGQGFAAGYPETAKLSEVMLQLNETSLSQLRRDHETDHLEHKIAQASK